MTCPDCGDRVFDLGCGECCEDAYLTAHRCTSCGEPLEPGPYGGWSGCGDCFGGREPDGEAFRGGEAMAYERDQQADIQRRIK